MNRRLAVERFSNHFPQLRRPILNDRDSKLWLLLERVTHVSDELVDNL